MKRTLFLVDLLPQTTVFPGTMSRPSDTGDYVRRSVVLCAPPPLDATAGDSIRHPRPTEGAPPSMLAEATLTSHALRVCPLPAAHPGGTVVASALAEPFEIELDSVRAVYATPDRPHDLTIAFHYDRRDDPTAAVTARLVFLAHRAEWQGDLCRFAQANGNPVPTATLHTADVLTLTEQANTLPILREVLAVPAHASHHGGNSNNNNNNARGNGRSGSVVVSHEAAESVLLADPDNVPRRDTPDAWRPRRVTLSTTALLIEKLTVGQAEDRKSFPLERLCHVGIHHADPLILTLDVAPNARLALLAPSLAARDAWLSALRGEVARREHVRPLAVASVHLVEARSGRLLHDAPVLAGVYPDGVCFTAAPWAMCFHTVGAIDAPARSPTLRLDPAGASLA